MEYVFKIIRFLKAFQILVGKLSAKCRLKRVFAVEYNLLALQCSPHRQTVAQGFAHTGEQVAQRYKLREQMFVVHAVKRQTFHTDDEGEMACFVVNDVVCNVLADFRQKIRLCRLRF